MNKTLKIALNILIFVLIAGFGYYMVHSITSKDEAIISDDENSENTFVSPYKKTKSFNVATNIGCFDVCENAIYVVLEDKLSVFNLSGKHQLDFAIKANVRDIVVEGTTIYLLYPTEIELYSLNGQKQGSWEACSDNSDYCSITTTSDYVFVTDAENKLIVQYNKEGQLVRFIRSPEGFIIPSYAFDIMTINDTVYCVNSGRHRIESYTLDGEFIASFGMQGTQAGEFVGCCNPVYIAKTANGNILTSEKGSPRISCYNREGKFRSILFDTSTLGEGTTAYEMKVLGENIFIANKKTVSIYVFDPKLSEKSCAGCNEDCPLRQDVKK